MRRALRFLDHRFFARLGAFQQLVTLTTGVVLLFVGVGIVLVGMLTKAGWVPLLLILRREAAGMREQTTSEANVEMVRHDALEAAGLEMWRTAPAANESGSRRGFRRAAPE